MLLPRTPKHEMKSIPRRNVARLRCAHALSGSAGRGMQELDRFIILVNEVKVPDRLA